MGFTTADIAKFSPSAQKQILDKLKGEKAEKRRKYKNQPANINGIRFDSAKEAARYQELMLLRKAGQIRNLRLQVDFPVTGGWTDPETGERTKPQVYKADFVYEEQTDGGTWEKVVEDVKGYRTQVYINKKKLVEEKYGIQIRET